MHNQQGGYVSWGKCMASLTLTMRELNFWGSNMTEVLSLIFGYRVSSRWQQLRGSAVLVGCIEIRLSQSKYGETKFQGRVLGLAYYEKTKKATVWEGLINLTNRPRWRGERGIRNTRWEGMWQQNKTPPRRKKRPLRPPKRTARADRGSN